MAVKQADSGNSDHRRDRQADSDFLEMRGYEQPDYDRGGQTADEAPGKAAATLGDIDPGRADVRGHDEPPSTDSGLSCCPCSGGISRREGPCRCRYRPSKS